MTIFLFRPPGAARRDLHRSGLTVPPGMLAFAKARPERIANRNARERVVRVLERELADTLVSFREAISLGTAEAAVIAGDARIILNAAAPNELEAQLAASLAESLEEALESGARIGFRFAPPELGVVSPSLASEAAVGYIERQAATAVVGATQATQEGIRELLALATQDQLAPVEAARRIGELAGLDRRQVRAVANFRAATTARLAPVPEALTPQVQRVIDQEVARYRDRQLLYRGRRIAQTETQAAITQGEAAFWDEAAAQGVVDPEAVFKTWRTVRDSHVCPHCEPLHGQTIPYRETFVSSLGARLGPPLHPNCRCYLEYAEGEEETTRPDRGGAALRAAENRRFLDRTTLQEDLTRALARRERTAQRLARLDPSSRAAARLEDILTSSTATVQSLQARLDDFRVS